MTLRLLLAAALLAVPGLARAQAVPDVVAALPDSLRTPPPDDPPREVTFVGFAFTRTTASNVAPSNDLLQGQTIGRLFGPNSTTTDVEAVAFYSESRFVPYVVYAPKVLDGFATFRALGKIDYTWGDQAYGVGGNRGGGLNAGQINLQTLLANVEIRPSKRWHATVGLQRIFDNARDPHEYTVAQSQASGYKLGYWGTQGVGATLFATPDEATHLRAGVYQLYENQVASDDDVSLVMLDAERRVTPRLELAADLWWLRDRSAGAGGISILGQGLPSALAEYNGAPVVRVPQTSRVDVVWAGARAMYNRDFVLGPFQADAFVMGNVGRIDTVGTVHTILGGTANAHLAYKYGMTANDRVELEAIAATGDGNGVSDGRFSGVLTGNVWGSPVGIYSAHRAYLLFPDPQVVNRYYSAVHDLGHMGYGVVGGALNVWRDVVPNRVTGKVGVASAFTPVAPPLGGGPYVGTEVNASLTVNLRTFLTLGVQGAYLLLGDFYDSPRVVEGAPLTGHTRPDNPWVAFVTLSWLMF